MGTPSGLQLTLDATVGASGPDTQVCAGSTVLPAVETADDRQGRSGTAPLPLGAVYRRSASVSGSGSCRMALPSEIDSVVPPGTWGPGRPSFTCWEESGAAGRSSFLMHEQNAGQFREEHPAFLCVRLLAVGGKRAISKQAARLIVVQPPAGAIRSTLLGAWEPAVRERAVLFDTGRHDQPQGGGAHARTCSSGLLIFVVVCSILTSVRVPLQYTARQTRIALIRSDRYSQERSFSGTKRRPRPMEASGL